LTIYRAFDKQIVNRLVDTKKSFQGGTVMKRKVCLSFTFFFVVLLLGYPLNTFSQPKPAEPIIIGAPSAMGHPNVLCGWKALQMAAEEINAKGGILVGGVKRPIRLYMTDTRDAEPGIPVHDALLAMDKLILERKPHAILLGPLRSEVLLSSMDLIAKYQLPFIASQSMVPLFQKKISDDYDKYKYCFRNSSNSMHLVMYLQGMMEFMKKEFGFNKVYIVVQDVLWAKATGEVMQKWYKGNGWDVLGFDSYTTGATDFSPTLIKAGAQKAQVVMVQTDMSQAGILARQAFDMKLPGLIVGQIVPVAAGNAWKTFGGALEGVIITQYEIGSPPAKAIPKSMSFVDRFGKRWGEDAVNSMGALGTGTSYDSLYILADAIERAGSLEPNALVRALEKTDLTGVLGRIRFGKDHQAAYGFDPKETSMECAFQWKKPGRRVIVFPETIAEEKIDRPPAAK
jgi:branched-chain amino acid transport system substrate-binding protein